MRLQAHIVAERQLELPAAFLASLQHISVESRSPSGVARSSFTITLLLTLFACRSVA